MTTTTTLAEDLGVKVGDFFIASWGYDQTNIDFFKVVGVTSKGVRLQKWTSARTADQPSAPYQDKVVPGDEPDTYTDWSSDEPVTKDAPVRFHLLKSYTDHRGETRVYTAWKSYANLSLWNGTPAYETGWGYGH